MKKNHTGRKSVKLNPKQLSAYKKFIKKQHTKLDAALSIGINTHTLNRVALAGSGSPDSIKKIVESLNLAEL